ncbi:MAG: hypothetical protein QX189_09460 [Methylococcales bacterium]
MKKLLIALVLTMANQAQAYPLSEATTAQCQEAAENMAFSNAYERVCNARSHSFNRNINVWKMHGCSDKVSLNELRQTVAINNDMMAQTKYKANDPYFCMSDEMAKAVRESATAFMNFEVR